MNYLVSDLTDKELIESLLKEIEKNGFHIIKPKYNKYCFHSEDDYTICEFKIKEIKGFLFGLWNTKRFDTIKYQLDHHLNLWSDYHEISSKSELVFFTQYIRDIDKFKPSRSGFVVGLYRRASLENDSKDLLKEWYIDELLDVLNYMKKHKLRSIEYAGRQTTRIWEEETNDLKFVWYFIRDWYYYYKIVLRDKLKLKRQIYISKRLCKKLKDTYCYIVYNHNMYPHISICLRSKNHSCNDFEYDNDLLDNFEDKYRNLIDINYYELTLSYSPTKEDFIEDEKLKSRFLNRLDSLISKEYDDEDLIYTNIK